MFPSPFQHNCSILLNTVSYDEIKNASVGIIEVLLEGFQWVSS